MTDDRRDPRGLRDLQRLVLALVLLVVLALVTGCAAQPRLVEVKVPVPIVCQETEPTRPAMPTDGLQAGASLDAKVAAALAEIDLRDGYELRLVAALRACLAPIGPAPG